MRKEPLRLLGKGRDAIGIQHHRASGQMVHIGAQGLAHAEARADDEGGQSSIRTPGGKRVEIGNRLHHHRRDLCGNHIHRIRRHGQRDEPGPGPKPGIGRKPRRT